MSNTKARPINTLLGTRASYGPIPADLIVPWACIALMMFTICHSLLSLDWQWTVAGISWGCAVWLVLVGSRPYRYLSKFVPVPRQWTRGYVRYKPLKIKVK